MTDRHAGYIVTLADDVREDDAEAIVTALSMVKGVKEVSPDGSIATPEQAARAIFRPVRIIEDPDAGSRAVALRLIDKLAERRP